MRSKHTHLTHVSMQIWTILLDTRKLIQHEQNTQPRDVQETMTENPTVRHMDLVSHSIKYNQKQRGTIHSERTSRHTISYE